MNLERRTFAKVAVGAFAAGAAMPAKAVSLSHSAKEVAAVNIVRAFYRAHNKGHWGTLSGLLSEHVRGRSNSGWTELDSSCKPNAEVCSGSEKIGGRMEDRESLVSFLQNRQKKSGWMWSLGDREDSILVAPDGYVTVAVEPFTLDGKCWGPGVLCGAAPRFVHVFWCDIKMEEGAVLESRIGDFTEVELMKVGVQ